MSSNPDTRFLTILRATMDEIEGISPLIQDNIYLRLVNYLQSLYDIHTTNTITTTVTNTTTTTVTNTTVTNVDDTISEPYESDTIDEPYDGITNNVNITNFNIALSIAEYLRDMMTLEQRDLHITSVNPLFPEEYRNNININNPIFRDYNRQIRQMVGLWETMSSEEQRIYLMRPENVLPHSSGQDELFTVYQSNDRYSIYSRNIRNILNTNDSDSIIATNNITNFTRVLSVLDTTYDYWTHEERSRYASSVNPNNTEEFRNELNSENPIFSDYNRLMREALGYWRAISPDEQRNFRSGPHINDPSKNIMNDIVLGGPIDRIVVFRPPTHPAEIYDVL
jgi:hypothetical protein